MILILINFVYLIDKYMHLFENIILHIKNNTQKKKIKETQIRKKNSNSNREVMEKMKNNG